MKLILSICLVFLSLFQSQAQNQENKGRFLVETGVKLIAGETPRTFIGKTGISLYQHKHEFENYKGEKDNYDDLKYFSYSIAPRFGYYLGNNFITGIDLMYLSNNYWYEYCHYTGGFYARYYFFPKKFSPFLEFGFGFGKSEEREDGRSPGGAFYQKIAVENLNYLNGSIGCSYHLSQKFDLSLALKLQQTIQKFNDKSNYTTNWYKKSTLELVPFLSFCYYFN